MCMRAYQLRTVTCLLRTFWTVLFTLSMDPSRWLERRQPGDQNTVSFGLEGTGTVLWAAYPRSEDGAKVVVLSKSFRRLPARDQAALMSGLSEVAPELKLANFLESRNPASGRRAADYTDTSSPRTRYRENIVPSIRDSFWAYAEEHCFLRLCS